MKRYRASFGILTAVILAVSSPVLAHEECDDAPQANAAAAERGETMVTLKDVVDAQAAKDWPKVYTNLRMAAGHMAMIGDPLGMAIAQQFPERYARW